MHRLAIATLALAAACGGATATMDAGPDAPFVPWPPGPVTSEPQRDGDPAAGYTTLVDYGYITCGIPRPIYERVQGPAPAHLRLPGRSAPNEPLPYFLTATTSPRGVEIVAPNCLLCHAGQLRGETIVGLGNHASDYTTDAASIARVGRSFARSAAELAEFDFWYARASVVSRNTLLPTAGPTPADNVAAVLFAHRDPETLAWLDEPRLPLPPIVVPVDVPAWWLMRRKNAMFYTAAGRGDHGRLMMSASLLCTESPAEAADIDSHFGDVRAFIASIEPPAYPFPVDTALAGEGEAVFAMHCARCHGTYSGTGATRTVDYPNLVVPIEEVATDPILATGAGYFSGPFIDWFSRSFYGETARLEPASGYVAPPLEGVWATAPYLHNGSVPTIAALLESSTRPRYWSRTFDGNDYDPDALGWRFTPLERGHGADLTVGETARIYDTTLTAYGNGGHTFGDVLTPAERRAVLEYLKTL
jgi:mono/diheme cytochrome c family protein